MALVHAAVMGVFYCCFIIVVVVVTMTIMIIRIIFAVAVPVINDIVIITLSVTLGVSLLLVV